MKTLRQLLREPLKTLMGILLVTLAVAVLCVCLGQSIAAQQTEARLNNTFQTAAFPSVQYGKEADQWVRNFARDNPKIVETIHSPGLASAYIPQLSPDNYTAHRGPGIQPDQYPMAMLVVQLTNVIPPAPRVVEGIDGMIMTRSPDSWYQEMNGEGILEWKQAPPYIGIYDEIGSLVGMTNEIDLDFRDISSSIRSPSIVSTQLTGVVEEVVGLESGYASPVGHTATISLTVGSMEEFNALDLNTGDRILVYSHSYFDDWRLRNDFSHELDIPLFQVFDPEKIHYFTNGEKHDSRYVASYDFGRWIHGLKPQDLNDLRTVRLLSIDPSVSQGITCAVDESAEPLWIMPGHLEHLRSDRYGYVPGGETPVYPVKEIRTDQVTYTDANGGTHTVTADEFHNRYARPTVAQLDGTVEEFLKSPEGALWKQTLSDVDINNHAFPIIGVENLQYIPDFLRNTARITQGRDFTDRELETGSKVCVISQILAEKNGLTVGDTITLQLYEADPSLPNQVSGLGENPVARFYHSGTTRLEESETYTIVGIYQKDIPWDSPENNPQCFTPNAIFAPKSALPQWLQEGFQGPFRSVILHGRGFRSFMEAAAMNFDGQLYFYDNGYEAVAESLESYRVIAGRVFAIGVTVYAIMMALYLLLYPAQQRKILVAMERLGASQRQRISQVMLSSMGILLPGTVLGAAIGALLWNRVVQALLHSAESNLAVEMEPYVLALVALAQLALMGLLVLCTAVPMSRSRGISDRR